MKALGAVGIGPGQQNFTGKERLELLDGVDGKCASNGKHNSRYKGRHKKEGRGDGINTGEVAVTAKPRDKYDQDILYASAKWRSEHNFNWDFLRVQMKRLQVEEASLMLKSYSHQLVTGLRWLVDQIEGTDRGAKDTLLARGASKHAKRIFEDKQRTRFPPL